MHQLRCFLFCAPSAPNSFGPVRHVNYFNKRTRYLTIGSRRKTISPQRATFKTASQETALARPFEHFALKYTQGRAHCISTHFSDRIARSNHLSENFPLHAPHSSPAGYRIYVTRAEDPNRAPKLGDLFRYALTAILNLPLLTAAGDFIPPGGATQTTWHRKPEWDPVTALKIEFRKQETSSLSRQPHGYAANCVRRNTGSIRGLSPSVTCVLRLIAVLMWQGREVSRYE